MTETEYESQWFSFTGRPYTQIKADKLAFTVAGPGERALNVQFGPYTLRVIVDLMHTVLVGFDNREPIDYTGGEAQQS